MTDAIVTRQLTKCYDGHRVVNGLNLSIPRGSVYGLLGRNEFLTTTVDSFVAPAANGLEVFA